MTLIVRPPTPPWLLKRAIREPEAGVDPGQSCRPGGATRWRYPSCRPVAAALLVELAGGFVLLLLPLLPQAAASSATAASRPST